MARARLGSLDLLDVLGRGGMGTVWRARNRRSDGEQDVAVKVLTTDAAKQPGFAVTLEREVSALAGLDHPRIVSLYDHGTVPEDADPNLLPPGSPYLVMELALGGTLMDIRGRADWARQRSMLLGVLEGLAHAHARGFIHRDVKPANVLLDASGSPVLTDFGLAHVLERADQEDQHIAGTPLYMSPEQVIGRWRDHGPWSDLYAVGVIGWQLATGRSPFGHGAKDVKEVMEAHVVAELPPFRARGPVPEGLFAWLRRMMSKDPRGRYRRAADAAWALLELPEAPDLPPPASVRFGDDVTLRAEERSASRFGLFSPVHVDVTQGTTLSAPPDELPGPGSSDVPPLPDWRVEAASSAAVLPRGAGLGLVGMRRLPLVGRVPERDALWAALRAVGDSGRARVVALAGGAGFGKSRLAEWLSERAHEVGAANYLKALHAPTPGPAHGLGPMLGRQFRCVGLGRVAVEARVERLLEDRRLEAPADEAMALTTLIHRGAASPLARQIRFERPAERYAVIERVLDDLVFERPVVLWLDDVQWGLDALQFVERLMADEATDRPVLVVLTFRDDLLLARPAEQRVLGGLLGGERASTLEVGPLPEGDRPLLLAGLLSLDRRVALQVEERTAGNPLFAAQLVGDWVQRGLVVHGPAGFELAPGASVELPDDIHQLWSGRLERLLATRPASDAQVLELAAALGQEVSEDELRRLCGLAGLAPARDLVPTLVARRLARWDPDGGGWAFVHGMLRETLEQRARAGGRWSAHNSLCAGLLEHAIERGTSERLARYLAAAGRLDDALPSLRAAIELRDREGDSRRAAALGGEYRELLARVGATSDDPRVLWARLRGAIEARTGGDFERAERLARNLAGLAESAGIPGVVAQARFEVGYALEHRTQLPEALRELRRATEIAHAVGDLPNEARYRRAVGQVLWKQGQSAAAAVEVKRALELSEDLEDRHGEARSLATLATISRQQGRMEDAVSYARRSLELCDRQGFRGIAVKAWNMLGEARRLRGDLDGAAEAYHRARDTLVALGSPFGLAPELNLGLVLTEAGRYPEARRRLQAALDKARRLDMAGSMLGAVVSLLPCDAAELDWDSWDTHFAEAGFLLQTTGFLEADCPRTLEVAADLAVKNAAPGRARRAWDLAIGQWLELERQDDARAAQRRRDEALGAA